MKTRDALKSIGRIAIYALKTPFFIRKDREREREINGYINTAIETLADKKNPDYDFVLRTLEKDYPVEGLLSHSAKISGEERIKLIRASKQA
jgi:hypothetical protein